MQTPFFKLTALAALTLALSACGGEKSAAPSSSASGAAATGGASAGGNATLVYCSEGSPGGFDFAQFTDGTTFDASAHAIFNGLVEFKKGTTELEPSLAEKWDISEDGLVYTFHLRPGVKFQTTEYFTPSREFNADDVVFTLQRLTDKNLPFNKAYPAEFPYAADMGMSELIKSIEKVDDKTVKVTLNQVNATFLANLGMPFAYIHSAEYAGKLEAEGKAADLNIKPVGTGPFVLKSYQKDQQIRYVKHADYWDKDNIHIDNLVFAITKDSGVRAKKVALPPAEAPPVAAAPEAEEDGAADFSPPQADKAKVKTA